MIKFADETRIVVYSNVFNESRRFYEETLDLKVVSEWDHGNGDLGVVYALGTTHLEILQQKQLQPVDNHFYIYLKVENVDALWNQLRDRAPAVDTIQTQHWGHRNFSVQDPNGYKLKFFSEIEKSK